MVRCDLEPAGPPQTHHVSQVVHPQLVGVHAQRRLLVVGINHPHVLLPDGSANLFLALRQKKKSVTLSQKQSGSNSSHQTLMGYHLRFSLHLTSFFLPFVIST